MIYFTSSKKGILSNSSDEVKESCSNLLESLKEVICGLAQIVFVSKIQNKPVKLEIPVTKVHYHTNMFTLQ